MFPADGHFSGAYLPDGTKKLYGHGHAFYEEVSRVPLVVRMPDPAPGDHEVMDLVSQVDIYDTLGELMDLDLGPQPPGRFSLAPLIATAREETAAGEAQRPFAYLSANINGPRQLALRTDVYKLITYPDGERGDEVYDLTVDPFEKNNLSEVDPDALAELKATLEAAGLAMTVAETEGPTEMSPEVIERLEALGYLQ
jgi:arylsulfatase A-like enzyme